MMEIGPPINLPHRVRSASVGLVDKTTLGMSQLNAEGFQLVLLAIYFNAI